VPPRRQFARRGRDSSRPTGARVRRRGARTHIRPTCLSNTSTLTPRLCAASARLDWDASGEPALRSQWRLVACDREVLGDECSLSAPAAGVLASVAARAKEHGFPGGALRAAEGTR